ncbi:Lipocalin-like [Chitinophaga terrae (ex Kim and Jung 2007)]|uniref:Lipocalin-like n=1 Tax=Chitinophaga terrae (ex Kim and Jung 2007) TaxID=408074 RepID=A0A1H4G3P0_9BACT|nr:lipocalin family protein [Chitinophaga terrae (ex Kim and Jung 2007)]GEP92961.1 hypothetical protein CTE07_46060 [Chitinophaga terrae (ex Kim and Jung 2007)]SEB04209.1 Lipocalin-like [Chitinophaga terrae (ex Kim and Jung 2007)]
MRLHLILGLLLLSACGQSGKREAPKETYSDSSLIGIADSSNAGIPDSTTAVADTLYIDAAKLIGKWIRPVEGLDKEVQGFQLRKNGTAKSINMYTLVYEKWQLINDTLLLWNHSEGVRDTTTIIDTTIIKALSDTSLVLFPIKAADGYTEHYIKQ